MLRVALVSDPPSLDIQATTALAVAATMHHVYEGLFVINSKLQPVPMLAERYTLSADPLTYMITLRQGVPFHHGREMIADDVVASLTRWGRLRRDTSVVPVRAPLPSTLVYLLNKRSGVMVNPKVRQVVLAAIAPTAILQATYGHPQFFRADPGLMPKEHYMRTDAGKDAYNQKNADRARKLLAEAGYRGEPVRWLVTSECFWSNNSSQVTTPILERAGFNVDLQVMDWPTTVTRRSRFEGWDVTVAHTTAVPDPTLLLPLSPSYPGWYESRDMVALLDANLLLLEHMARAETVGGRKDRSRWTPARRCRRLLVCP